MIPETQQRRSQMAAAFQTVKKPQFEKELSLRGAQPRGNPFPKTLRFWTHCNKNGNILGMRIATSPSGASQ